MLGSIESFGKILLRWYAKHRRDLPWRVGTGAGIADRPDPYQVLVSEAMLQQTQVATVVPYFARFMERFPTLQSLAAAEEQAVLRLWQGLGYYSRARNLRAAAKMICETHGGMVPAKSAELLSLPGVGRYTAGAIGSIAHNRRVPILDGNVCRVLCRIDAVTEDPREPPVRERLWQRAEALLPRKHRGHFNSALMELGATVCTPRGPRCDVCPVRESCEAFAAGIQEQVPVPKKALATPLLRREVFCIRRGQRWLIEQRPRTGRWAGLWQFITVARGERPGFSTSLPRRVGTAKHALSHRRYRFDIFTCELKGNHTLPKSPQRRWVTLRDLDVFPLPRPHVAIAQMLAELSVKRDQ
jgi:A/G-specific adenine glycosylase